MRTGRHLRSWRTTEILLFCFYGNRVSGCMGSCWSWIVYRSSWFLSTCAVQGMVGSVAHPFPGALLKPMVAGEGLHTGSRSDLLSFDIKQISYTPRKRLYAETPYQKCNSSLPAWIFQCMIAPKSETLLQYSILHSILQPAPFSQNDVYGIGDILFNAGKFGVATVAEISI